MSRNVWTQVLDRLEMRMKRHDFIQWMMSSSLGSDTGEAIEVRVPDQNRANWIKKQYLAQIQEALAEEGRANTRVDFAVGPAVHHAGASAGRRKGMQGRDIDFPSTEPWDAPVDGAELLGELARAFQRFVTLAPHASTALALWTVHTYAHDAFFHSPYLAITSPMKQCGKTTLLSVLETLVLRGQNVSNMTGSVLFRVIDAYEPTLLIDEADTFLPENEQLRGLLNAGHSKKSAWLLRNVGDDYLPRKFSTWCPKAIAAIGRLPGTIEDRSIQIRMRRQREGEDGYRGERIREDLIDAWHLPIRQRAQRWTDDHLEELRRADPVVPRTLQNRPADCWRPLFAIADLAGQEWPQRARAAAEALSGTAFDDEQEIGVELLRDLAELMTAEPDEAPVLVPDAGGVIASADIVKALAALPDRPWACWRTDKPLTTYALSKLLRGLSVYPSKIRRSADLTSRGYRRDAFEDAFSRYLPEWLIGWNKPNVYGGETPINHSFLEPKKIVVDQAKTPVNIDERSTDQPLSGKSGKTGVIDLRSALQQDLKRAPLKSDGVSHFQPRSKGRVTR